MVKLQYYSIHIRMYCAYTLIYTYCTAININYNIMYSRTGQIFEQSRSSEETDRNVDVSTAKVFVSTMLKKVESDWPNIYSNLVTL